MLDAFGRIPQAITQGNNIDLGSYDQCLNVFHETNHIKGKYCLNGLNIPLLEVFPKYWKVSNLSSLFLFELSFYFYT